MSVLTSRNVFFRHSSHGVDVPAMSTKRIAKHEVPAIVINMARVLLLPNLHGYINIQ